MSEYKLKFSYGFDVSMAIISGVWKMELAVKFPATNTIANAVYQDVVNIASIRPPNNNKMLM